MLIFNQKSYENSKYDGMSILEVSDGEDKNKNEDRQLFVPLKNTNLEGVIIGPLAFAEAKTDIRLNSSVL